MLISLLCRLCLFSRGGTGIQETYVRASGFSSVVQCDAPGKHEAPGLVPSARKKKKKNHKKKRRLFSPPDFWHRAPKTGNVEDGECLLDVSEPLRT